MIVNNKKNDSKFTNLLIEDSADTNV